MIVFFASVHKRFFIPELNLQSFTYICIGTSIVNFIIEMIWNMHHTGVSNVYRRKSCHHHNNLQIYVKSWPTRNTSQKFISFGDFPWEVGVLIFYEMWHKVFIWFQLVCNWLFPCARSGQRSLHCRMGRVTVRTQGFCTAHRPWLA